MILDNRAIECPIRRGVISALECHTCPNCMRVLYRSEFPPEHQCMVWRKFLTVDDADMEDESAP